MPVGTGSISRAAKSAAPKKSVKKTPEVPVAENGKETVAKTKTSAKAPTKAPVQRKTKNVKAEELKVYGEETMFVVRNECCHLTEELPVHLL